MTMIAFDTNLLVRLAVNDNLEQAQIAEDLLNTNEVFISRTVLLETEWILRSAYKNVRADIALFLDSILSTQNMNVENSFEVSQAIKWYELGADFAGALHLCMSEDYLFHTFDKKFCQSARDTDITPKFKVL